MKYRYEEEATGDLFEAAAFYESRQPGLGNRFRQAVEQALERILADPESFPKGLAGTRSVPLKRFPYQIVFLVQNDTVEIYAVAHHKRRPGYWVDRLPDPGH